MKTPLLTFLPLLVVLASPCLTFGAEIVLENPRFVINIPDLEELQLGPHPNAPAQKSARLFGAAKTGETLSVLTPTSDNFSALQCAAWLTGDVLARFVPSMDAVQIIKIGDNAYVAIFPFVIPGMEQLKAFIASGDGKGNCLQVHISRVKPTDQQREAWFKSFREVRVRTQ